MAHRFLPAMACAIRRISSARTVRRAHSMSSEVEFMDSILQLDH